MPKFERIAVALVAQETTPGIAPSSGYTAIPLLADAGVSLESDRLERNVLSDTFSPAGGLPTFAQWKITLPVYLKGGGLDGGALAYPEVDALLRCAGLGRGVGYYLHFSVMTGAFISEEFLADTGGSADYGSVVFVGDADEDGVRDYVLALGGQDTPPVSSTVKGALSGATVTVSALTPALIYRPITGLEGNTATVKFIIDGLVHEATAVRGNAAFDFSVGDYAKVTFTLSGLYTPPTDGATPEVAYRPIDPVLCVNAAFVAGDFGSGQRTTTQANVDSLSLDLGNTVSLGKSFLAAAGIKRHRLSGRTPSGSFNPSVGAMAGYDIWSRWKKGRRQSLSLSLGKGRAVGEKVAILVPRAQYTDISYQNQEGILHYNVSFTCTGSNNGDDELFLIFS